MKEIEKKLKTVRQRSIRNVSLITGQAIYFELVDDVVAVQQLVAYVLECVAVTDIVQSE